MQKIFRRVVELSANLYFWWLDYLYVAYWQVRDFFSHWNPRQYEVKRDKDSRPSIVLIPGIYESWKFMRPLAEVLYAHGYDVRVIEELKYNRGSVEDMAQIVDSYLHSKKIDSCVFVAHSKGGLIGKYLLARHNQDGRIKGLVAINTPFTGSPYAYLFPFRSIRAFSPRSPILQILAQHRAVNSQIVSIYGIFDPHIPAGSYLEGAANVRVNTQGHFRIMGRKAVHEAVLKAVELLLQEDSRQLKR